MRDLSRTLVIALLLASPALTRDPAAFGQDTTGTGTISGVVLTAAGKPAAGVTICIVGTGRCVQSSEKGEFRLSGIRLGEQHIEVRAPGLPPFESGHVDAEAANFAMEAGSRKGSPSRA